MRLLTLSLVGKEFLAYLLEELEAYSATGAPIGPIKKGGKS